MNVMNFHLDLSHKVTREKYDIASLLLVTHRECELKFCCWLVSTFCDKA